mmetsp:Transcript_108192/g.220931  ORF Transcript_108192/g.220931 Transcript_108192/m.220931 type:complete len:393 (+) Transcript_108192:54-1232(+)
MPSLRGGRTTRSSRGWLRNGSVVVVVVLAAAVMAAVRHNHGTDDQPNGAFVVAAATATVSVASRGCCFVVPTTAATATTTTATATATTREGGTVTATATATAPSTARDGCAAFRSGIREGAVLSPNVHSPRVFSRNATAGGGRTTIVFGFENDHHRNENNNNADAVSTDRPQTGTGSGNPRPLAAPGWLSRWVRRCRRGWANRLRSLWLVVGGLAAPGFSLPLRQRQHTRRRTGWKHRYGTKRHYALLLASVLPGNAGGPAGGGLGTTATPGAVACHEGVLLAAHKRTVASLSPSSLAVRCGGNDGDGGDRKNGSPRKPKRRRGTAVAPVQGHALRWALEQRKPAARRHTATPGASTTPSPAMGVAMTTTATATATATTNQRRPSGAPDNKC